MSPAPRMSRSFAPSADSSQSETVPCWMHEHLVAVRLTLPEDVFVRLVEPDPPAAGERQQIHVVDSC